MPRDPKGCILFDWGDTLMRDFSAYRGPMKDWPRVEAIPGALETLELLHPDWTLAIATNANDSDEADIRLSLRRVDLDQWIERVYCFRRIGHKKPAPAYYQCILDDLQLPVTSVFMVGDNYEADVLGANGVGIRAIWFNAQSQEVREDELRWTIHSLGELPAVLSLATL